MTNEIYTNLETEEQEGDIGAPLTMEDGSTSMKPAIELATIAEPTPHAVGDDIVQHLYQLINQVREQYGKGMLHPNGQLQQAAQYHSDYMANHHCFDHQCSGEAHFKSRILATGYRPGPCAENIGLGQRSAQQVVNRWMNSPGHRRNLLGNYVDMGCGYAYRHDTGKSYWTFDAASPRKQL